MAKYDFNFRNIQIWSTRSRHEDTDYAGLEVKIGDTVLPAKSAFLGGVNNGIHEFNLRISDVEVPNNATPVKIGWSVLNSGHQDHNAVVTALQTVVDQIIQKKAGDNPTLAAIASLLSVIGIAGLFANCDGPVAGGLRQLTGAELYAATSGVDYWIIEKVLGGESAAGCGSNSDYNTVIVVHRTAN